MLDIQLWALLFRRVQELPDMMESPGALLVLLQTLAWILFKTVKSLILRLKKVASKG